MLRLVCLVRILEMPNRRSRAKGSPTRLPPNDADVDGASAVRPATTVGRGGRAAPLGQAQGQAQGQAVAAGTSSRLSLLMLRGPPGETAKLTCFSVFVTYIYCVNQSVVSVSSSEVVRFEPNPIWTQRPPRRATPCG